LHFKYSKYYFSKISLAAFFLHLDLCALREFAFLLTKKQMSHEWTIVGLSGLSPVLGDLVASIAMDSKENI
jgi:hypothetical protein